MAKDFLDDENGDILIQDGDFVIGDSSIQHQRDLLVIDKGEIREFPLSGIGIFNWIDDDNLGDAKYVMQEEYGKDGANVKSLSVSSSGQIKQDVTYD